MNATEGVVSNTSYDGSDTARNMTNRSPEKIWKTTSNNPMPVPLSKLPDAPPNALPGILDLDLKLLYQHLVGTATYLGMTTHPELTLAALALS